MGQSLKQAVFLALAAVALTPLASAPLALGAGVALALLVGNPFTVAAGRWTTPLLQVAVVGLGAATDLRTVARVGLHGLGYTTAGIALTLGLSAVLTRLFGTDRTTSRLVGIGTAICGGSAIAALSPVLRAKSHQTSVALAVVFVLNAVALVAFPAVGRALGLSQEAFGMWSALAIHDTSSVVGAALQFGPRALEVATTMKLARALWILPVALVAGRLVAGTQGTSPAPPARRPWFILAFVAVAALVTWVPALASAGQLAATGARHVLVLALFLVGSTISREALVGVGVKPLVQGVVLWLAVASASLAAIVAGWVRL